MVRSSSLAIGICLFISGIAAAGTEDDGGAHRSLRMRPGVHIAPRSHASQGPQRPGPARGRQLAQAPAADPPADPAAADPAGEPPVAISGSEPSPLTSPRPAPTAVPAPPEPPA